MSFLMYYYMNLIFLSIQIQNLVAETGTTNVDPTNCGESTTINIEILDAWEGTLLSLKFGGTSPGFFGRIKIPVHPIPKEFTILILLPEPMPNAKITIFNMERYGYYKSAR